MTKAALRKHYREKRLLLGDHGRNRMDDLLLINFQQWEIPDHVQTVLSYWPIKENGEVNTFLVTDFMEFRIPGMQLCYPVSDFRHNHLQPVAVNDDTNYKRSEFGIAEPVDGQPVPVHEIDMVIVPLLAFDLKGYRLGYGRGFYDRFLATCRPDVIRIGFSYFEPEPALPGIDQYDIPLSACITPEQIYEF